MSRYRNYIYEDKPAQEPLGVKGQKGQTGPSGIDGRKGERGAKGSAGLDGHTSTIVGSFYRNSGANLPKNGTLPVGWDDGLNPPTPFTLEVGESLVDIRTNDLWTFTPGSNVTNWTKLGKVSGPRGTDGAKGDNGAKGQRGEKGAAGLNGVKGAKGLTGAAGFAGATGAKGQKGHAGSHGLRGALGPNGLKGQKGEAGADGFCGKDGAPGAKGDTGAQGKTGATGSPGPRGVQGLRGQKGEPASGALLPKAGGTIDISNNGLLDQHNVLQVERLESDNLRVHFRDPLASRGYTAILTAQSLDANESINARVVVRELNYLDIAVTNATGETALQGYVSMIVFRFV